MPISRLLHSSSFDPSEIDALIEAFNIVCRELKLEDESDPLRELIARQVITAAENGTRDPLLIRAFALAGMKEIRRHRRSKTEVE
jgi:hypothetical protein